MTIVFGLVKSSILDKEPVQKVVSLLLETDGAEGLTGSGCGSAAQPLGIIDAFDFPKFRYDPIKKIFHQYVELILDESGSVVLILVSSNVSLKQEALRRSY